MMDNGWIKLHRGVDTAEIIKDPKAFALLSTIAIRARRTDGLNIHGLLVGEALIGDHKSCGLSRQEYRTAKNKLKKWGLVTFKTTNKGTIAKLINDSIYDINALLDKPPIKPTKNQPATSKKPAENQQATTNKKENKERNDNNSKNMKSPVGVGDELQIIKNRFSNNNKFKEFSECCAGNIELMKQYLKYADNQKKIDNPVGLAISMAKERKLSGPPGSSPL